MSQEPDILPPEVDDKPPVLQSWKQLYLIVLLLHAIIIGLFYWFTHTYTA